MNPIKFFSGYNWIKKDKQANYFKTKTGPSTVIRIPFKLNKSLACFIGIVIGDGHLTKDRKRIMIVLTDFRLVNQISDLIYDLFRIRPHIYFHIDKRENRKPLKFIQIDNALIYNLLKEIYFIPSGKKSDIVRIPFQVINSSSLIKKSFLIGFFAADGGKRHKKKFVGSTTASFGLNNDLSYVLNTLSVPHKIESWLNKKYKKEYFGLYFKKVDLEVMTRRCRSGQTGQILTSLMRKLEGQA